MKALRIHAGPRARVWLRERGLRPQDVRVVPGAAGGPKALVLTALDRLLVPFAGREHEVLEHAHYRVHVITSRGRHILRHDGGRGSRITTPLGYLGAALTNAASRRAMGAWLERVVFSDARDALPFPLDDFRTVRAPLRVDNLRASILASCTVPFWLESVRDIPGGPRGAYWDGGITDYHLHLRYASIQDGLVLYPHFQPRVIPGWLDKGLKHRHRASAWLDNLVLLSPSREWIESLPARKLPDRDDFKTYGQDHAARKAAWKRAVDEGQRLADEMAARLACASIEAEPLA